jgi:hypothetical protein
MFVYSAGFMMRSTFFFGEPAPWIFTTAFLQLDAVSQWYRIFFARFGTVWTGPQSSVAWRGWLLAPASGAVAARTCELATKCFALRWYLRVDELWKLLTTEIADNGVPIYSSVWVFKLELFVHGPSSVFSSASILFQRKCRTGSKGTIKARLICVNFYNALFFLWLINRN